MADSNPFVGREITGRRPFFEKVVVDLLGSEEDFNTVDDVEAAVSEILRHSVKTVDPTDTDIAFRVLSRATAGEAEGNELEWARAVGVTALVILLEAHPNSFEESPSFARSFAGSLLRPLVLDEITNPQVRKRLEAKIDLHVRAAAALKWDELDGGPGRSL